MSELRVSFKTLTDVLEFVKKVEKYPFDMDLSRGSVVVDAKSLLGIMNLGLNQKVDLKVYADECSALRSDIEAYIAA